MSHMSDDDIDDDDDNDNDNESPFEVTGTGTSFGFGARRRRADGAVEESSTGLDLGSSRFLQRSDTRSGRPSNKPVAKEPERGRAIASLAFGVISLVFDSANNLWLSVVGLVLAISGTILAVQAKRGGNTSGVRLLGLVISIFGIALCVNTIIIWIFVQVANGATP